MKYTSNEQLVTELKKIMLDKKVSQREIAAKLGVKPQGLVNLLNKKNFSFSDVQKILEAMNFCLDIGFIPDGTKI